MVTLNLELLVDLGGWPALREAKMLVQLGKVSGVHQEGNRLRGRVQGPEKIYEPLIRLGPSLTQTEVQCTCPESRRSGRVCAHALALGLALLEPPAAPQPRSAPAAADDSAIATAVKASPGGDSPHERFWREVEPDDGAPDLVLHALFPLQLAESLAAPSWRLILEATPRGQSASRPWEAIFASEPKQGVQVGPEDARLLAALAHATGQIGGINFIPREQLTRVWRALSGHPRLSLGKKQQIRLEAQNERPSATWRLLPDGALQIELAAELARESTRAAARLPLPGWSFDGTLLRETSSIPTGFDSDRRRLVSRQQLPDFLTREWPQLEQQVSLQRAAESPEWQFVVGRPRFTAKLEGTLAALTLQLEASYGPDAFPLQPGATGSAKGPDLSYRPDLTSLTRYWARDLTAEQAAANEALAAGFAAERRGTQRLSLRPERAVAAFLANRLARWRQAWSVEIGPSLSATLREIDIAEPEFAWREGAGNDWLALDLQLKVGGKPVPLAPAEVERWLQTGQSHGRTASKRTLLIPTAAWGEMREVLADASITQTAGEMRVPRAFTPFVNEALRAEGFRAGSALPEPVAPDLTRALSPQLLACLRPYQRYGVEWLAHLAQRQQSALLADDMGLGKTLQALAFASWLRAEASRPGPILVVCPTSLVVNWQREAARFAPTLRTLDLTGPDRAKRWAQRAQADLLITSYAILRRDVEQWQGESLLLAILDEAQQIKNRPSQNAVAARKLPAQHRLLLTGTPLENSLLDLWSLFEFLAPGYLGSVADFRERYETPLSRGADPRVMERLRRRVKPFFLRRTREEVLTELPPRLEQTTLCPLSGEQRAAYTALLEQGRRNVFDLAAPAQQGRQRLALLTTLLRLRQACCHLALLPPGPEPTPWREPSAKLERTFELVEEAVAGGHRILLFSQFVRMLHLLREEAQRREIPFCYLDGETIERQAEVDRFQREAAIPLFLISLKAGGTGLNLTAADTVIHFDPWWNPAVEEQATARAHRLGQTRSVQAYRLIAAGTVEEKIQALQAKKKELFAAGLGTGDDAFVARLSSGEMAELLADA